MNKLKEQLLKERTPVHGKCLGKFFTEEEAEFLKAECCSRVEAVGQDVIVDDETGETEKDPASIVYFCTAYVNPDNWWKNATSRCPLADHYRPDLQTTKAKVRAGQQKQKKR